MNQAGRLRRGRLAGIAGHAATRVVLLTGSLAVVQTTIAVLSARWLGPADRGVYTIAVVISSFSLLVGSLGVYTGGRVRLSTPGSGLSWRRYVQIAGLLCVLQLLITVVVDLPIWASLVGHLSAGEVLNFVAYSAAIALVSLLREGLHGIGRHGRAVLGDVLASVVQLAAGFVVYLSGHISVAWLLACATLGCLVQLLLAFVPSVEIDRGGLWSTTRTLVAFSLPSLVVPAGQLLIQKGDRLLLGIFASPAQVGIYGAGATIADAAWILPTSASIIVLRRVATSGSLESVPRWRLAIVGSSVAAALVLAVAATWVIGLLLGPAFSSAPPIVWILCVGSVFFASQQVDIAACNGASRLGVGAKVTAAGTITLLVLSFVFMPLYEARGAAVASVLAYLVMAIVARRYTVRLSRGATT